MKNLTVEYVAKGKKIEKRVKEKWAGGENSSNFSPRNWIPACFDGKRLHLLDLPSLSLQHLLLTSANAASYFAFEFDEILAPLLGSVHVCGALIVRVGEHRYNRDHDSLYCVNGQPPFTGLLIAPLVISWLVKNGYAHITIFFNCTEKLLRTFQSLNYNNETHCWDARFQWWTSSLGVWVDTLSGREGVLWRNLPHWNGIRIFKEHCYWNRKLKLTIECQVARWAGLPSDRCQNHLSIQQRNPLQDSYSALHRQNNTSSTNLNFR